MGQFIREPITVLGPNDKPSPEVAAAFKVISEELLATVRRIMRESVLDAVTVHTLLFQQIALQLCLLDLDAADKYMDAMRRNMIAGVKGDRSGVALDEMAAAGQALEDAFALKTRADAGSA